MDEPWVRLAVVLAAAALVAVVSIVSKRKRSRRSRRIASVGLAPGVYLFTAASCQECEAARRTMAGVPGLNYVELAWEDRRETFDRLAVDEVPSTLIVAPDSSADWHRGVPVTILESRNP